ncbi:MAG: tetraacyldisaccharide 4'-kinase [Candidatus Omnitrophota bacterium]
MRDYIYNLAHDKKNDSLFRITKAFLLVLSFFYGLAVWFVKACYRYKIFRKYSLGCKVISVGNITWGGTGKTPAVEYIARKLSGQGRKVAILSRGYGKRGTRDEGRGTNYETMGDEPYMLKKNLPEIPVLVGRDRIKNGTLAIKEYGADVIILDDGFQHWRVRRDLEIVVIDSTNPIGNGRLIPRGILREDILSLDRAGVFLLSKVNLTSRGCVEALRERLNRINPRAVIAEAIHSPCGLYDFSGASRSFDSLRGAKLSILSSIAEPDSFKKVILGLAAEICLEFKFADHYAYKEEDLGKIFEACRQKDLKTLITTEKDAARLGFLKNKKLPLDLLVLRIELKVIQNEEEFLQRLFSF